MCRCYTARILAGEVWLRSKRRRLTCRREVHCLLTSKMDLRIVRIPASLYTRRRSPLHLPVSIRRWTKPGSRKARTLTSAYTAAETDAYLHSKLVPPKDWANDPSLKRSRKRAEDAGIPAIAVSPMQAQFLTILAKGMRASKILEIGTLWG